MNDARNRSGQAYALTVLTPILPGHESRLASYLDGLGTGPDSPLALVPGTHFARWVIIGDVVLETVNQRRDHLGRARLLFTSSLDGTFDRYLPGLVAGLAAVADEIWGHCAGYPGHADAAAFGRYLRRHQVESAMFFSAYAKRTVAEVERDLATRHAVIDFALRAQGMEPEALQAAFREAFPA